MISEDLYSSCKFLYPYSVFLINILPNQDPDYNTPDLYTKLTTVYNEYKNIPFNKYPPKLKTHDIINKQTLLLYKIVRNNINL